MSDFSRVSNFNPKANFKLVRIGADCPVLEIELNEMQQISAERIKELTRNFIGEGVKGTGSYSYSDGNLVITNEQAIIDGTPLTISKLELAISEGEKAYLQVWLKEITYRDDIKANGNMQEEQTVPNKILDTNIGIETSRRMQIQFDLVKDTNLRSELNPANLLLGSIKNGKFELEANLYKGYQNTRYVDKYEITEAGETTFHTTGAFRVNSNSLDVYVNGVLQLMGYDEDYVEVNSNTFRFNNPVPKGSEVIAKYNQTVVSVERPNTHGATHNASGDDPVDISDLADRNGVRLKLEKAPEVLKNLGASIETATPLNAFLESNITQAREQNAQLQTNINSGRETNDTLHTTTQEAEATNTKVLDATQKAKDFVANLENSQNLVKIREDVDNLQNQLKDVQNMSYEGSDLITCNNSLEGRTTGLKLYGRTLYKRKDGTYTDIWEEGCTLESCGEAEGNKISILTHGKNLFKNFNINKNKYIDYNTGEIRLQDNRWCSDFIYVKNIKSLTLSGTDSWKTIWLYDNNKKYINKYVDRPNNCTISVENAVFCRIGIQEKYADNNKIQLEENTQATPFELYKEYKKEIQLTQPLMGLETVQDTIEETNEGVVLTQRIGKIVLNGTENSIALYREPENTNSDFISFAVYLNIEKRTNYQEAICNLFYRKSLSSLNANHEVAFDFYTDSSINLYNLYFYLKRDTLGILNTDSDTDKLNKFKNWIKINNIVVYYELAKPKTYLLKEAETDTKTYEGKTYVQSLNIISPFFDFSIPTNYNSITKQQGKEINRIWDMIDNVILPCILDNNYATNVVQLNRGMFIPDNK